MSISSRLSLRPRGGGDAVDADAAGGINEKRMAKSRDWPVILLTALRFCQLAYAALAYYSLGGFGGHGAPHQHGLSLRSSDQTDRSTQTMRIMRWLRMQAFAVLIYQVVVLVTPCLLRILKTRRWLSVGLATVFADGCAAVAALNMMVLLDTPYGARCHGPPHASALESLEMLIPNPAGHAKTDKSGRARSVCRTLSVIVGLSVVFMLSHALTALLTMWRARNLALAAFDDEAQHAEDVEQGPVQRPSRIEGARPQPMLQRRHTPPPPYHTAVPEPAGDSPRGRPSTETTSSLSAEAYLVSDGWRAPEEPPVYSSRPPSLHNSFP